MAEPTETAQFTPPAQVYEMTPTGPVDNPETGVDTDYAETLAEAKAMETLRQEQAVLAAPGAGQPAAQPSIMEPDKPSAVAEGVKSFGSSAVEGIRNTLEGLAKAFLPRTGGGGAKEELDFRMQSIRQAVVDGLMQVILSPFVGAATAGGQSLENLDPAVANQEVLDAGAAYTMRHLLAGAPARSAITPEQDKAWRQPATLRELVETAITLGAPFGPKVAKAAGKATKALGQRGSIGPPPEPIRFQPGDLEGLKPSLEPGEMVKRAEKELPGGTPEAIEARVNELLGMPSKTPGAPPATGAALPTGGISRLNVARVTATDSVKTTMSAINALQSERLAESRRTRTHAETREAGKALELTVEQAMALDPLAVPLGEARAHQDAVRNLNTAAGKHMEDLAKKVAKGDESVGDAFDSAWVIAGELSIKQEMFGTEGARITEARKMMAEGELADFQPTDLIGLKEKMTGAVGYDRATLARRLLALPSRGKRKTWVKQSTEMLKLGKDMFHELWINSLLTNPVTHAANVGGTGMTTAWAIPERAFAEGIHRLFSDNPEGVQRGETAAIVRSLHRATSDGFRLAGKAAQRAADLTPMERELLARTATERPRVISSATVGERMGWDMNTPAGKALDTLGAAANLPVTGLAIEDAFFKGVNYRMELAALALREAKAEGFTGGKLEARIKALETDPTASMMAEAVEAAMVRTLNAELGPAGQLFMNFMNSFPGGRVIAPFIRTPINSFKWFGQRAPILAQLSAKNWSDVQAGGAKREMAIARQAIGAAFAGVIAYEVAQGNITGGGSTDKWLRKMQRDPATTTRPPYSIKVGDQWVSLARFDPIFGTFVGAVADYIELAGQIPTQDTFDEWAAHAEGIVIATGHIMVNKTWMQSASALLDAINDPDKEFGKVRKSYARSLVPAGLRAATRTMDENVIRDVKSVTEAIKSGLPYFVDDVPVDRNPITGDAVEYPPGWGPDIMSPVLIYPNNDDPVFKELIANKIHLTPVPRAIGGTAREGPLLQEERPGPPIPLDASQRDYWILAMTKHAKIRGQTLHEALTSLVTSERYQTMSDGPGGTRELIFKATYNAYKEKSLAMLLGESKELKEKMKGRMREKGEARLPITNPKSPQYGATPGGAEDLIRSLGR